MSWREPNNLPRAIALSDKRTEVVSVLDVGTSKVCCVIAKLRPRSSAEMVLGRSHTIEVIGLGHQQSRGIKSGVVVNVEEAERSIRKAVEAAEKMAGVTVDSLIVNVSSGRLNSEAFSADISLDGHSVRQRDISQVLAAGAEHALAPERAVLHSIPIGYSLDGEHGISSPLEMVGERLGVDMHVVTAETAPLRNLELCINRSHLSVANYVATPYAAGLASLVEDEMQMGCACIDIGGGTTTLSVFMNGRFVFADAIAIGGHHVTMDLARGLSTGLRDAEMIKVKHGSALLGSSDADTLVTVPAIAEDDRGEQLQVSRSQLIRIIRPRVEETLEMVRDRLSRSGFANAVGKRLVLTGGASQLNGMVEVSRRILSRNVRMGRPMGIAGLPEAAKGPAFSTVTGLLIYPQISGTENFAARSIVENLMMPRANGTFGRLASWFKDSF